MLAPMTAKLAARLLAACVFVACLGVGPQARAGATAAQDIEAAEQAYANLDFPEANKMAERIARTKGLSHDQLVRTYRLLALTYSVLDKEAQAKDAFIQLLTYDPDYQVDTNLGPKVQTPFFEARGFWRGQSAKPGLDVSTVLRPREAGVLRVTLRDPTHIVKKVAVGFRWGSATEMTARTMAVAEASQVEIPAPPAGSTRLDYFVQALDDRDDAVFELGNLSSPKSAVVDVERVRVVGGGPVQEEKGSSVFASPVFWILAGVVVAGGAAGTYFAVKGGEDSVTRVPASSATMRPILGCGGSTVCTQ